MFSCLSSLKSTLSKNDLHCLLISAMKYRK